METIFLIQSIFIGVVFGTVYGIAFSYEKRRALQKYIDILKQGGQIEAVKQIKFFSINSILRYFVLIGSLGILIYNKLIDPLPLLISFLLAFWIVIIFIAKKKHENRTF